MSTLSVSNVHNIEKTSLSKASSNQESLVYRISHTVYDIFYTLISVTATTVACSLYVLSFDLFTWLNPEPLPSNTVNPDEFYPEENPWTKKIRAIRKASRQNSPPIPKEYWKARTKYMQCFDQTCAKILQVKTPRHLITKPMNSAALIFAAIKWAGAENELKTYLTLSDRQKLLELLATATPKALQWLVWETPENLEPAERKAFLEQQQNKILELIEQAKFKDLLTLVGKEVESIQIDPEGLSNIRSSFMNIFHLTEEDLA